MARRRRREPYDGSSIPSFATGFFIIVVRQGFLFLFLLLFLFLFQRGDLVTSWVCNGVMKTRRGSPAPRVQGGGEFPAWPGLSLASRRAFHTQPCLAVDPAVDAPYRPSSAWQVDVPSIPSPAWLLTRLLTILTDPAQPGKSTCLPHPALPGLSTSLIYPALS